MAGIMKFRSYQNKLIEDIGVALKKDKIGVINDFKSILSNASKLFKTDRYDFWLSQLGKIPAEDIPMTKYGFDSAICKYGNSGNANRNELESILLSLCEALFTYSSVNEVCELQSDYHFYYDLSNGVLFKESELGMVEPADVFIEKGRYRIALKSELNADADEFL